MSLRTEHTARFAEVFPHALIGILELHRLSNPLRSDPLIRRAEQVEDELRSRYAGADRASLLQRPTLQAYASYYRRFGKTYHVLLQLESVLFRDKPISGPTALVQAMLMAELQGLLLTAGHNLEAVEGGLTIDVSDGNETYALLNGSHQRLKPNDMYVRDEAGVMSSVLYGPDHRTRLTPETRDVVFVVYAPEGIPVEEVDRHLANLVATVRLISPDAEVAFRDVLGQP